MPFPCEERHFFCALLKNIFQSTFYILNILVTLHRRVYQRVMRQDNLRKSEHNIELAQALFR